jgi:L-threonylcarbamoyladenylate synthase
MIEPLTLESAVAVLHRGGVIAYPTEAVWGLGCDPFDAVAVRRLLAIKEREESKGLILIAANLAQIASLIDRDALPPARIAAVLASWPGPHTWLLPCTTLVPDWLRGDHATLALRVTAHPGAAALCAAFGGPLVSTSANRAGAAPARTLAELDPALLSQLDGVFNGETGGLDAPTTIRDAASGSLLRA